MVRLHWRSSSCDGLFLLWGKIEKVQSIMLPVLFRWSIFFAHRFLLVSLWGFEVEAIECSFFFFIFHLILMRVKFGKFYKFLVLLVLLASVVTGVLFLVCFSFRLLFAFI